MNFQDTMKTLEQALVAFGLDNQLHILQEECGELIAAINHDRRSKILQVDLISEMVDVEIMIEQMKLFYPASIWQEMKDHKLKRLQEYIEKHYYKAVNNVKV